MKDLQTLTKQGQVLTILMKINKKKNSRMLVNQARVNGKPLPFAVEAEHV